MKNRLSLIKSPGLFFALCAVICAAQAAEKPNILFLLSDDHSYPDLGCYGSPDVLTPNLDRLASEGMRFDRMFVSSPSCVPSRASLMTGRSPVGVRMGRFTSPLPPDVPALPDLLRDKAGYFVGVAGRDYHLDGPKTESSKKGKSNIGAILDEKGMRTFQNRLDYVEKQHKPTSGGRLETFLDAVPKDKPWFLWLGYVDPHHVWKTQGPRGAIDPQTLTLPPYLPDLPEVRADYARYLAEIEHLDADVQTVLDTLKARGLDKNTIVVFMGDNGQAFPHGKGSLYDPGLHVPLIVRWPGVVKPGSQTKALVSGEDFAPTMLAAAGVTPPKEMTGKSYLSLLRGEPYEARAFIFGQRVPHGGDGGMRAGIPAAWFDMSRCVRSDKFKLIYNCTPHGALHPIDSDKDPSWQAILKAKADGQLAPEFVRAFFTQPRPTYELYDLESDPGELRNLAGNPKYKDVEHSLKLALTEKMTIDWDFLPTPLY